MESESKTFFNINNIRLLAANIIKFNIFKTTNLNPLIVCYLVDYNCNYECYFCSRVPDQTYVDPKERVILQEKEYTELLRMLKEATGSIYFSGGEPLLHPDIVGIVREAKKLKFRPISLSTNASLLHSKLDVLKYLDLLIISVNTLKLEEMVNLYRINKNIAHQALSNIYTAIDYQDKYNYNTVINIVIAANRISNAYEIIRFCQRENIAFTISPEMTPNTDGCKVEKSLLGNKEYQALIDYIINLKVNKGGKALESLSYLKIIRDLKNYNYCIPYLLPCIGPNGGLYYPCPEKADKICENILEAGSYFKALRNARKRYGKELLRCCHTNFKPGNIEPSILVRRPYKMIWE